MSISLARPGGILSINRSRHSLLLAFMTVSPPGSVGWEDCSDVEHGGLGLLEAQALIEQIPDRDLVEDLRYRALDPFPHITHHACHGTGSRRAALGLRRGIEALLAIARAHDIAQADLLGSPVQHIAAGRTTDAADHTGPAQSRE